MDVGQRTVIEHNGSPLVGRVLLAGGKHAFSHVAPVAALCESSKLTNVPDIIDAHALCQVLRLIFDEVDHDVSSATLEFSKPRHQKRIILEAELVSQSRSVYGMLPALLNRCETLEMRARPTGCVMGERPDDWYFRTMEAFGVRFEHYANRTEVTWHRRQPAEISFEYPTMTGTVIAIAAACAVNGRSVIEGASVEPSCSEQLEFAKSVGYSWTGQLPAIEMAPSQQSSHSQWRIGPDRVHATAFLIAGLLTGGTVSVASFRPINIPRFLEFLCEAGVHVLDEGNEITATLKNERLELAPVMIDAGSEPYFSSDWLAATVLLLATRSHGRSVVTDNVFPDRLQFLNNLRRIGLSNVRTERTVIRGRKAVRATIEGTGHRVLTGGSVGCCSDLRGSTALALSGLISREPVVIENDYHLRRGYTNLSRDLRALRVDK